MLLVNLRYQGFKKTVLTILALLLLSNVDAQSLNTGAVDTLKIKDRLAFRLNFFDALVTVPNVGVEYDIRNLNYNRWTIGLNLKFRPGVRKELSPSFVYNIFDVRLEARNYWRPRPIHKDYFPPHDKIYDKLMSLRRTNPHHPKTTYYRGIYVGYSQYSLLFSESATGHQGRTINLGGTYGIVRNIHRYRNGSSLDLDLGLNVGFSLVKNREYRWNPDYCYTPTTPEKGWKPLLFPVPHDLHVSLVYRPGTKAVTEKYFFRYDVDDAYKKIYEDRMDSIKTKKETYARNAGYYDEGKAYYEHVLDSILKKHPEYNLPTKEYIEKKRIKDEGLNIKASEKKKEKSKSTTTNTQPINVLVKEEGAITQNSTKDED